MNHRVALELHEYAMELNFYIMGGRPVTMWLSDKSENCARAPHAFINEQRLNESPLCYRMPYYTVTVYGV
jgi:hypothetical protein